MTCLLHMSALASDPDSESVWARTKAEVSYCRAARVYALRRTASLSEGRGCGASCGPWRHSAAARGRVRPGGSAHEQVRGHAPAPPAAAARGRGRRAPPAHLCERPRARRVQDCHGAPTSVHSCMGATCYSPPVPVCIRAVRRPGGHARPDVRPRRAGGVHVPRGARGRGEGDEDGRSRAGSRELHEPVCALALPLLQLVEYVFEQMRALQPEVANVSPGSADVLGRAIDCLPNPLVTRDFFRRMQADNVLDPLAPTKRLHDLGIEATSLEMPAHSWLHRHRTGSHFLDIAESRRGVFTG